MNEEMKVMARATLPSWELMQQFIKHLGQFQKAHPDCSVEIAMADPGMSFDELLDKVSNTKSTQSAPAIKK